MIYKIDLRTVGVILGSALVILHILAILHAGDIKKWLITFPRSRVVGIVLVLLAAAWSFWLVATMDLGEFTGIRLWLMILVPVAAFCSALYVDEFLSVRALGVLLLLVADPVLEAAFLRPEASRLLLVVLAYVWIVLGIFWVGMPYLMRDQIGWLTQSRSRWVAVCVGGAAYGAMILVCALLFFKQA